MIDMQAQQIDSKCLKCALESVLRALVSTNYGLKKDAQDRCQNDAVAVDQRTPHQRLRSKGTLGHA